MMTAKWTMYGLLALQMALLGFVGYAYLEPPYLSYGNVPFPVLTPVVKAGETVVLDILRCNRDTRPHTYVTARQLVRTDGTITALPAATVWLQPGCETGRSAINVIPKETPPGKYRVFGWTEITDRIFPTTMEWSSDVFEVVNGS